MNVLIIEDDTFLSEKIRKVLEKRTISNRIKIVKSYHECIEEIPFISSYDIILTDLQLTPYVFEQNTELDGYKIIESIRRKNSYIPIIVISGFNDIEKLRFAFSIGASDYITKPFRLAELEIRITNWYRNYYFSHILSGGKISEYKNLRFDIDKNEFYLVDRHIPLTKNSKYLLSLFFSRPETVLNDSFLKEKIWWDYHNEELRNPRVNILRLKKSLEPFGIDSWISNIRWEWYIFQEQR